MRWNVCRHPGEQIDPEGLDPEEEGMVGVAGVEPATLSLSS